jgi:hypothetical protein
VDRISHVYPSPTLARVLRSEVSRWLAVVLIAPMLILGMFNGTAFLAQAHNEHGVHLHSVRVLDGGSLAAADHAVDHGHEHEALPDHGSANGDEDGEGLAEVPQCVIFAVDVHKQLPTRSLDLRKSLTPAAFIAVMAFVIPTSPDLDRHVGSPGGAAQSAPMDLLALSASDRLVRTSRALLI